MAFGDLVNAAKKNTPQKNIPSSPAQASNLIEVEDMVAETKVEVKKKDISYKDSEITGLRPQQRVFGSKTTNDPRHGSIVRNISHESDINSQMETNATWQECKHRKEGFGKDYCKEYHSICYKEKCNRAKK